MSEEAAAPAPDAGTQTETAAIEAQAAPETPPNPLTWDPDAKAWVHVGKVDGKEWRAHFEELTKSAQLAKSAQQRFEEAKAVKQQAQLVEQRNRILAEALVNPRRAMELWQAEGLDPRQMLAHMQAEYEAEQRLTPEQRELRAIKADLARRQEEDRKRDQAEHEAREAAAQQAEDAKYEAIFSRQMDALKVPANPRLRAHMSQLMWATHDHLTERGETMPAREVAAQTMDLMREMARDVIASMSPDERAKLLGPEIVTGIATARVQQAAAPIPKTVSHQPRERDGRFSRFTTFTNGAQFSRLADEAEARLSR